MISGITLDIYFTRLKIKRKKIAKAGRNLQSPRTYKLVLELVNHSHRPLRLLQDPPPQIRYASSFVLSLSLSFARPPPPLSSGGWRRRRLQGKFWGSCCLCGSGRTWGCVLSLRRRRGRWGQEPGVIKVDQRGGEGPGGYQSRTQDGDERNHPCQTPRDSWVDMGRGC